MVFKLRANKFLYINKKIFSYNSDKNNLGKFFLKEYNSLCNLEENRKKKKKYIIFYPKKIFFRKLYI